MSAEWYEEGYPGGPMVEVPGFPRPLYPPSAWGKDRMPSKSGPDVEAYKRTVSRAGRWPWTDFDQIYGDGFAHGLESTVKVSGIAGVQRQQHIEATGWLGEKTFNTLRSILIPEPLSHAGMHAMDAVSARLIEDAWEIFGGVETPDPTPVKSLRQQMLELAITQLGYRESPAGSNSNKFGRWYGYDRVPWCAIFVTWAALNISSPMSQTFVRGSRYAYCPYLVADARAARYGMRTTDDPIPGDIVVYDWNWNGEYDHMGIYEKRTSPTSWTAIEGNTSLSSNSNGGEVMRRDRTLGQQATVFVRVGS